MEIFESLKIDIWQITFYLISFFIAMYVLNRFVFGPVARIMTEREKSIADALNERDNINEKVAHADEEAENIIQKAKEQGRKIIEEAHQKVEPEKQEILKAALEQGETLVKNAQKQAAEIVTNARLEANKEAVEILKQVVNKAMSNLKVDAKLGHQVTEQIIEKI